MWSPRPFLCLALCLCCCRLAAAWPGKPFPFGGSKTTGWVEDFGTIWSKNNSFTIKSNTRAYLVDNVWKGDWFGGDFKKFNLKSKTFNFTVDLSHVGCGCIACLYFVPYSKPGPGTNYCDGLTGCVEVDLMEANMMAFHTSLHTEGGKDFNGHCNTNGCAANIGRYPYTNSGIRTSKLYGPGALIDSKRPFQVQASWEDWGAMHINLAQDGKVVPLWNTTSAYNMPTMFDGGNPDPWNYTTYPRPTGVPVQATGKSAWQMDQGLRLVASLWDGGNTFWLDHAACKGKHWCSLSGASFTISDMKMGPNAFAHVPKKKSKHAAEKKFSVLKGTPIGSESGPSLGGQHQVAALVAAAAVAASATGIAFAALRARRPAGACVLAQQGMLNSAEE